MSPIGGPGENGERRGTIISYQASEITEITECGAPSEAGEAHTPTSSSGEKGELESSHRVLPAVTTGAAVLPEISEQSDRSSSSVSDANRVVAASAITSNGVTCNGTRSRSSSSGPYVQASTSPPSRIVGGLLMGALSAFTPILAGHTSSKGARTEQGAKEVNANSGTGATTLPITTTATPENIDETSGITQSMMLDKAEVEAMEKESEKTSDTYRTVKRSSAASNAGVCHSTPVQQSSPVPLSDKEPFCSRLIETSL